MPVSKPCVYALMWGDLVLYVGSTILTLHERKMHHTQRSNKVGSKKIPSYMDWEIVELEIVDSADRRVLRYREHYHYNKLHPLYNIYKPFGRG